MYRPSGADRTFPCLFRCLILPFPPFISFRKGNQNKTTEKTPKWGARDSERPTHPNGGEERDQPGSFGGSISGYVLMRVADDETFVSDSRTSADVDPPLPSPFLWWVSRCRSSFWEKKKENLIFYLIVRRSYNISYFPPGVLWGSL